jgi:hypothetical protein
MYGTILDALELILDTLGVGFDACKTKNNSPYIITKIYL